jgi:hypothetical protein
VEEDGYEHVLDELTLLKAVRCLLDSQPVGMRAVGVLFFIEGFEYVSRSGLVGGCGVSRV